MPSNEPYKKKMKHVETHLYKLSTILYEEKMCLTHAIAKDFHNLFS